MTHTKITPIILAGGVGTRLWPISRESLPKQFCKLGDEPSLFQSTVIRMSDDNRYDLPVILTGDRYAELVQQQLREIDVCAGAIICEPVGRDTAAAISLACEVCELPDSDPMLVLPSDHLIKDEQSFHAAVAAATSAVIEENRIVTFGIKPTYPETGFGYLRSGSMLSGHDVWELECFIEKPDQASADDLIQEDNVFWNAGIFMFKCSSMLSQLNRYAEDISAVVRRSVVRGTWSGSIFRPDKQLFAAVRSISFDYAIMEQTDLAATIPVDPQWSDLGSWKSVWESSERDDNNNYQTQRCVVSDCRDSYVYSDGPTVGVCGLNDIVVVANKDAVLVTSRENPQGVKAIVQALKQSGSPVVEQYQDTDQPWGQRRKLESCDTHNVYSLTLNPDERLSLQYHHNRTEQWIVTGGTATAIIGDEVHRLTPGQSVDIPRGCPHRLENKGEGPLTVIEVQTGIFVDSNDIIRLDDDYGRAVVSDQTKRLAA